MPFFRRHRPSSAPAQPDPPLTEARAQAVLCARLPELRYHAGRFGWQEELDEQLAALANGRSALAVLESLELANSRITRSGNHRSLGELWEVPPAAVAYRCPRGGCPDRPRNRDGSEPWCHLADQPLTPVTADPGRP